MASFQTVVTHLSMEAPFRDLASLDSLVQQTPAWPEGVCFQRIEGIQLDAYRDIYDQVGRQWHWVNRRYLNDHQLAALVHHSATEIYLLSENNQTIGFVELNFKFFPQVEIVFIGLIEGQIGKGYGPLMVRHVLEIIQAREAKRIIIQTCTLDHPAALRLYQQAGFSAYNRKQVEILDE